MTEKIDIFFSVCYLDESLRSCSSDEFACSSALSSAIVCFNSTVRCDSFADCPDQTDEQGCGKHENLTIISITMLCFK